ncbi:MAG: ribosome silencing factor [Flavobacteriales bacterium]
MAKGKAAADSEKLAEIVVKGIQEKKGHSIKLLDLRNVGNAISDFFIICHGTSNRQVDSIADSVIEEVQKATGEKPFNTEGKRQAEWVLLDYVNVVVHVFQEQFREHFGLEELWADAEIKPIEE